MLLKRDRAMTAIAIMLDVALHAGRSSTVSAADVAERLRQARRGIEPVLQLLTRAGMLQSVRGPAGGYRLGRPPRDLRLSDIVATVNDPEPPVPASILHEVVIQPLWSELDSVVAASLAALTLSDLLVRAARRGLTRQVSEPLDFTI